jgi:sugar fermentation stimulation protein A
MYIPAPKRIRIGRLGYLTFTPGIYLYVGSGGPMPFKRIRRHLAKRKRRFWHIDFLTPQAKVVGALIMESDQSLECSLARALAVSFESVKGFGSSDCRCGSHLFRAAVGGKEATE